jgi:uncharacterized protein YggL (DUF469 family)
MIYSGFEIHIDFKKKLNEEEQNILWEDFIDFIENKNLTFGGGHNEDYLDGFIDITNCKYGIKEIEESLQDFLKSKNHLIRNEYKLSLV